mmetsp:Transcript_32229/g.95777  ORF Transcript_32229/g.95777 Transcript_32229/m.95777 type:complete len:208 (+) Transcript_32229:126-749(+)
MGGAASCPCQSTAGCGVPRRRVSRLRLEDETLTPLDGLSDIPKFCSPEAFQGSGFAEEPGTVRRRLFQDEGEGQTPSPRRGRGGDAGYPMEVREGDVVSFRQDCPAFFEEDLARWQGADGSRGLPRFGSFTSSCSSEPRTPRVPLAMRIGLQTPPDEVPGKHPDDDLWDSDAAKAPSTAPKPQKSPSGTALPSWLRSRGLRGFLGGR